MSIRLELFADVPEDGILTDYKQKELNKYIKSFANKRIKISVERKYNQRSIPQNKFYWSCIVLEEIQCFKEFWGDVYTKEQIHEWNKQMFWADEQVIGDEVVKKPCSSTVYTTVQWEEKIELIRQWFYQKFEWVMPMPNEQLKANYGKVERSS